jgi:hypothetical protein
MEKRFCIKYMVKTSHEFVDDEPDVICTYKRKRLYKCLNCAYSTKKGGLISLDIISVHYNYKI